MHIADTVPTLAEAPSCIS